MTQVIPATQQPVPMAWQVNGLHLAGLSWGKAGGKPLLALHGWLDNAASFALLAPLLPAYHIVALDLTGHGHSDRRSDDASYQIWDDLPEILGVLAELGWDSFTLMGHSRGAIIASLLASAYPERVQSLILLDAVSPAAVAETEFPAQMRRALTDKPRFLSRDNRVFSSVEEAAEARQVRGIAPAAATLLAQRNLRECSGGLTWTTDPRLRGASAVKLTEGQVRAVLQALSMPVLLLLASDASQRFPELAAHARRYIKGLEVHEIEGGHHFHMESPVVDVARRVEQFLTGEQGRNIL